MTSVMLHPFPLFVTPCHNGSQGDKQASCLFLFFPHTSLSTLDTKLVSLSSFNIFPLSCSLWWGIKDKGGVLLALLIAFPGVSGISNSDVTKTCTSLWAQHPPHSVVLMQHLFEFKSKTSCSTDLNSSPLLLRAVWSLWCSNSHPVATVPQRPVLCNFIIPLAFVL